MDTRQALIGTSYFFGEFFELSGQNSEGNSVSTPKRKQILSKGDLSKVLWDADVMSVWDIMASRT